MEVRIVVFYYKRSAECLVKQGRFGRGRALYRFSARVFAAAELQQAIEWCDRGGFITYIDESAILNLPLLPGTVFGCEPPLGCDCAG